MKMRYCLPKLIILRTIYSNILNLPEFSQPKRRRIELPTPITIE